MPNQMLQVTLGGTTYTKDIRKDISRHFHGYDSEEYIVQKLGIAEETHGLIDWETIDSSNNKSTFKIDPLELNSHFGGISLL